MSTWNTVMDERDAISRREAIAGLGLLSVLAAGLIGTITYRIVGAAPHRPTASPVPRWSDEAVGVGDARRIQAASARRAEEMGAVDLVSTDDITQESPTQVLEAALRKTSEPETSPWNPPPASTTPVERPRFVAPASR